MQIYTAKAKGIAANMTPGNSIKGVNDNVELHQMSLFDTVKEDDIITEIEELDLGTMTPIDALNHLYKIQNKLRNRW